MTWWRRNRWALLALPFALLLAAAAAGDRIGAFWWQSGLHQGVRAGVGETLDYRFTRDDADGEHPVEVGIAVESVVETTTGWRDEQLTLPPGAKALRVTLRFTADPRAVLRDCTIALRAADGTRYDYTADMGGAFQPYWPCVPPEAPGPGAVVLAGLAATDEGDPRPETYTVEPVILVPADADPAAVLIWWGYPRYAELALG